MATPAEIRQRVGEDLALMPIGQTLKPQHNARILAAYGEVYERLKEKGLATWASTASVPTKLVPSFALMICEKLLTSFSVPDARFQRIQQDAGVNGDTAEKRLAELALPAYEDAQEGTDY